jgi:hypothetical protein
MLLVVILKRLLKIQLEDRTVTIENVDWDHCVGILTEAGILLEDGTTKTDGKVVKLIKEAKHLYDIKDYDSYMKLTCETAVNELTHEEYIQFDQTIIIKPCKTIGIATMEIEDILMKKRGIF